MKNKYQRMNKEEKKKCKEFYYNTPKGKEMRKRLNRLTVIGIIGVLFSAFLIISGYISNEIGWATWVMSGILFVFSFIFIIGAIRLRGQCLNQYAVSKMK